MALVPNSPSSSSKKLSCFQCQDTASDSFINGWRLRSGECAQLCRRCASFYEDGRFCENFHSKDEGWRDCESCGKLVHCGCIVSFNAYLLLDFGGIICMECSKRNFIQARNRCLSMETQLGNGEARVDSWMQPQIEPHHWPQMTGLDLQSRNISVVTPLFEKLLTASDTDLKLARLVIPKRCAEAFFPAVSEPHGFPIKIQDAEGKVWQFHFRYWPNAGSKMYVLEGLRDYMIEMKWQAGDVVSFYRIEPEGKLAMGLRRASVGPLHHEKSSGPINIETNSNLPKWLQKVSTSQGMS